ncbi:unnamed protein product [Dibothriocephalus latus]|uniref:Uncharacterized protein n=1 Tax=Dibothriocephalus latus TaxID=60516 RepID=A0A3P7LSY7_DIBLA|nr:unnamed protein product [Dibothriocephalus latus]
MLQLIFLLALACHCRGEDPPVPDITKTLKSVQDPNSISSGDYDVVVFLNDDIFNLENEFKILGEALVQYNGLDSTTPNKMQVIPFLVHPNKRMIFAPTGKLNTDISDSRQIYSTAMEAAKLAYSLNLRKPLFVLGPLESAKSMNYTWMQGDYRYLLMTLGALQGYYTPLIKRQLNIEPLTKYDTMGVYGADSDLLDIAGKIEMARILHRDTCASDPERMAAPSIEEYYRREFNEGMAAMLGSKQSRSG